MSFRNGFDRLLQITCVTRWIWEPICDRTPSRGHPILEPTKVTACNSSCSPAVWIGVWLRRLPIYPQAPRLRIQIQATNPSSIGVGPVGPVAHRWQVGAYELQPPQWLVGTCLHVFFLMPTKGPEEKKEKSKRKQKKQEKNGTTISSGEIPKHAAHSPRRISRNPGGALVEPELRAAPDHPGAYLG